MTQWALSIDKDRISDATIVETPGIALADGQARLAIRRFALTANNVTYAAFGHAMRYWEFFPGEDGRGRLPVWGFAEVAETRCGELTVGERIYGYFPAGSELIVRPGRIDAASFIDLSEHRSELPPAYNRYVRCAADSGWSPAREPAQMVLQPLFITSFLIAHFLREEGGFGASSIDLTSASSKTAIALAWMLKAMPIDGVSVRGLTSAGNADFVAGLGLYDEVVSYDDLEKVDTAKPVTLVDFAGSSEINRRVHTHLDAALKANIRVGGAHWEKSAPASDLPGPRPQFFFAPDHARSRIKAWGQDVFDARYKAGWDGFADAALRYFEYSDARGGEGALSVYQTLVTGRLPARSAATITV